MKRRLPRMVQSGLVLAANNPPPVTSPAKGHNRGGRGPALDTITLNASVIAANARLWGCTGNSGANPHNSTTTAANAAANTAARRAKRLTQSRAVECGTSNRTATGRTPSPQPTTATTAAPITSTSSNRPGKQNDGTNAWLTAHRAHRPRCSHTLNHPSLQRNDRTYPDQNDINTAHPGQSGRGTAKPRPAATYSSTDNTHGHTMAIGGNTALGPSRQQRPTGGEGPTREQWDRPSSPKPPPRSPNHHQRPPPTPPPTSPGNEPPTSCNPDRTRW